jgi:hypothetical protein
MVLMDAPALAAKTFYPVKYCKICGTILKENKGVPGEMEVRRRYLPGEEFRGTPDID